MLIRKGRQKELYLPWQMRSDLVISDKEKLEVFNNIFAPVFTDDCSSHVSEVPESQRRDWGNAVAPIVGEDQAQDHLMNVNVQKPIGLDEMDPKDLMELANAVAKPLSFIFEKSWQRGEFPETVKLKKITHPFLKTMKRKTLEIIIIQPHFCFLWDYETDPPGKYIKT